MKNLTLRSIAAFAALVLISVGTAQAKPVYLSVDAANSKINVSATALSGLVSASAGVSFSGLQPTQGINGQLDDIGGDPSSASVANLPGQGAFLSPASLNLVVVTATLTNIHVTIGSGGPFAGSGGTGNSSDFDLGGTSLTIDQGQLTTTGLVATTLDFGTSPASFNLPPATIATITLGAGPPTNQPVTLRIPVVLTTDLLSGTAVLATISLSGQLTLTGIRIPEPGTFALLGLGLIGIVPMIRSRFRKS